MNSWTFLLNAGVALALGLIIGTERQWRLHPAGMRTNTLVALGAALFVSLSLLMDDHGSPTRMASYEKGVERPSDHVSISDLQENLLAKHVEQDQPFDQ
jgi:hypothetical protein